MSLFAVANVTPMRSLTNVTLMIGDSNSKDSSLRAFGPSCIVEHPGPMFLAKLEDALCGVGRFGCGVGHAAQEELQPALPIAAAADRGQAVVVLGAVLLQVHAEVEQGAMQCTTVHEQERD